MSYSAYKKETADYRTNDDDFRAPDELTVTITLHEYRELVECKARHEEKIKEKNDEVWEMRKQRDEAKARLDSVIAKINGEEGEER